MRSAALAPFLVAFLAIFPASAPALGAGATLTLALPGPGEIKHIVYTCDDRTERLEVDYVNASPNFLALLPVEDEMTVFAGVLAGSGARYASGRYEWWTKGPDATLKDITAPEDSPPLLSCHEANDIP